MLKLKILDGTGHYGQVDRLNHLVCLAWNLMYFHCPNAARPGLIGERKGRIHCHYHVVDCPFPQN